ncbi:MAG: hypothetical protein AAB215_06265 [Planctomycetota bacterium]
MSREVRFHRAVAAWRRFRGLFLIAASVAAGGLLAGAATDAPKEAPKTVEAERFVLRGADGKERGSLSIMPDGTAGLALSDGQGRPRLLVGVLPDGSPALTFLGAEKDARVGLGVDAAGHASLNFADRKGQVCIVLGASAAGEPSLVLADSKERRRAALYLREDGSPRLALSDPDGKALFEAPGAAAAPKEPPSPPGAETPEAAVRAFFLGMLSKDEAAIRRVILDHAQASVLWEGDPVAGEARDRIKAETEGMQFRVLKPGDELSTPGGQTLKVGPEAGDPDRRLLMPTVQGREAPAPVFTVRKDKRWRVDAAPFIMSRSMARPIEGGRAPPGP